ncbi:hypothetical protein [Zavarzinia aquatilis]|uniref:Uncharacterized protein n=1 Tax=Zavarzinia aquatilis TaxID=2211142 RepID=A0A317EE58_9PROT|nr:hypothetical protein [Zavarzinia aquatilis]PWR24546.1 hypothetical protein DKG74_07000 [Zavarzinia aquatilis]
MTREKLFELAALDCLQKTTVRSDPEFPDRKIDEAMARAIRRNYQILLAAWRAVGGDAEGLDMPHQG